MSEYSPEPWDAASRKELRWDENGQPILTVKDFSRGGAESTFEGMQALKMAPHEALGDTKNTTYVAPAYYGPDDYREKFLYRMGRGIRKKLDDPEPTFIGRILNKGPVAGSLLGAGSGWLLGTGATKLMKLLNPDFDLPLSTIGLLGGGVTGGLLGYFRNKAIEERKEKFGKKASIIKEAMFRDPRNFILERLQGATDISPFEKAQLAAKVRQMDTQSAERLKRQVRAAMGFGVGALIAKFFFGSGLIGMGVGGLLGAIVGGTRLGNRQPKGLFYGNKYY